MNDGNPNVRREAMRAIGEIGPAALPILEHGLADTDLDVRG